MGAQRRDAGDRFDRSPHAVVVTDEERRPTPVRSPRGPRRRPRPHSWSARGSRGHRRWRCQSVRVERGRIPSTSTGVRPHAVGLVEDDRLGGARQVVDVGAHADTGRRRRARKCRHLARVLEFQGREVGDLGREPPRATHLIHDERVNRADVVRVGALGRAAPRRRTRDGDDRRGPSDVERRRPPRSRWTTCRWSLGRRTPAPRSRPSVNAPPLTQLPEDVQTMGPGDAAMVWFSDASPGISMAFVQYGSAPAVAIERRLRQSTAPTANKTMSGRPPRDPKRRSTLGCTGFARASIIAPPPRGQIRPRPGERSRRSFDSRGLRLSRVRISVKWLSRDAAAASRRPTPAPGRPTPRR